MKIIIIYNYAICKLKITCYEYKKVYKKSFKNLSTIFINGIEFNVNSKVLSLNI
jgi:hypothetical protein